MAVAQGNGYAPNARSDRLFVQAVALSIIAHALILAYLTAWLETAKRSPSRPAPPLVARLMQPQMAPPPLPEPSHKAERPSEPRPKALPAEPTRPILAAPQTLAPAMPVTPAPAAEAPGIPETATPISPGVVAAPPAKVERAPAPVAPVAPDAADPATLGQYRVAIISAAKRYKRYPRLALDNNWEGQAEVRMVIGADGNIASIGVRSHSGFEVLDQQALEMIRKAKPLAPIPPGLRGRVFTIDVPVVFSLKEEAG